MIKTDKNILPCAIFEIKFISDISEIRCHVCKNISDSDNDMNVGLVKFKET